MHHILSFYLVEPEPEKNSHPFKHPQGLDPDQPQASSSNSIDSIEDVDSTSSFSIPATRRRNRKNSKQKPKKGPKNVAKHVKKEIHERKCQLCTLFRLGFKSRGAEKQQW